MSYKHHWASPVITSGWQNYANGWVYSNGIGMPLARLDFYGNRPIRIHSFGDYYIEGPGSFMRLNYYGNIVDSGGIMLVNGIGGTFQWEAHQGNQTGSRMYFGRDPGCCTTTSANDGFVWGGLLAGSFYWDQVPNPPGISAVISARTATVTVTAPDNGGSGIDQYVVQYSFNGGAWTETRYGGSTVYTNLLPGNYVFRTWAHNAAGYSQVGQTGTYVVKSGGKRYNGTAFANTTIARRFNGSAFVDLTIGRRWNGSAWVDLS